MDDYSCEICFFEFNADKILPKVLGCGHSFCSPCIRFLIQSKKKNCPKCKTLIKEPMEGNYPTNFSLLGLASGLKNLKIKQSHLSELHALQTDLEDRRESLLFQIQEKSYHVDKINEDLIKINEVRDREDNLLLLDKMKTLVHDVKQDLVASDYAINFGTEVKLNPTLCLSEFHDTPGLFSKISHEIYNGKEVFVTGKVNDEIRFGKVSIWNKMLLIHSLTFTEVDRNANTISLDDFKKCVTKRNFNTFLKLPLDDCGVTTIVIKMIDSLLSTRFIKLCTGECGSSYKGVPYNKGSSNKEFDSVLVVSKEESEDSAKHDYDINSYEWKSFSLNAILVERYSNGGFEIFKNCLPDANYTSVVGRVVSNQNLITKVVYGSGKKIVDCGIGFYL